MSEEEQEAIEYLKNNPLVRIDEKEKIIATGNSYKWVILNLIDKLQKENKDLEKTIEQLEDTIVGLSTTMEE